MTLFFFSYFLTRQVSLLIENLGQWCCRWEFPRHIIRSYWMAKCYGHTLIVLIRSVCVCMRVLTSVDPTADQ